MPIGKKLCDDETLQHCTRLTSEEIVDLTKLCLTSTYFKWQGNFYEQQGQAMGAPLSPVTSNIFKDIYFLLILGLQLIICCVILTGSNWTKRWKIRLLQVVFKCLKNDAPSYLSSQFLFTSTIHSKNPHSQASNTLAILLKSILGSALFITQEALYGIAFQLTIDVIYLP